MVTTVLSFFNLLLNSRVVLRIKVEKSMGIDVFLVAFNADFGSVYKFLHFYVYRINMLIRIGITTQHEVEAVAL